ncbi:UNVERIFIED_CONTAM: Retrovirus-related Pol polyprotein from transposon opus [Sesamum indicum]
MTKIVSRMEKGLEMMMIAFLRSNADMFTWSPSDFRGISPEVIVHMLNVDPTIRPVQQRKRTFELEKNCIINDEIEKCHLARLVNKMLKDQIGKAMDVYVDDMLAKSQRPKTHLSHLKATFAIMRAYGMKLNPTKCTFSVGGSKFLRYMVSNQGIEANPENIEAILQLKSPTSVKDVQKLTVSENAVSLVLVRREKRIQNPIYYISKMLQGVEHRYTVIEKFVLALVVTVRRLRPYFQSHKVVVLTNQSLKSILSRPEASGRLVKWTVELNEYDIEYQGRTAEKGQILANFIMKLAGDQASKNEPTLEIETWMLHVDGSSNANNGGAGTLLQGSKGIEVEVAARLSFSMTNKEAEYEALILGL